MRGMLEVGSTGLGEGPDVGGEGREEESEMTLGHRDCGIQTVNGATDQGEDHTCPQKEQKSSRPRLCSSPHLF